MPIREDLLTPIPGDNPSGTYLYYAPIYDKIKEARREDDDSGPSGVWARERKLADWNLVIRLAGDALATQTKDLQLAAWLTEAYLKKEGFASFRDALGMLYQMVDVFWDTLYPEIEDGDAEFRATPLNWLGNFDLQIRMAPITRSGKTSVDYKVSRAVGYKADAESAGDSKLAEFNEKVSEGKLSADDFDADVEKTPKQYYVDLVASLEGIIENIEQLNVQGEEKFGLDFSPSYSKLRTAIEETLNTAKGLLNKKREKEPDAPVAGAEVEETVEEPAYAETTTATDAAPVVKKKSGTLSAEPQDMDDAVSRLVSAAKYMRQQDSYSPAPYLLLAGFRFGELRSSGDQVDAMKLEAPPTEIRQQIKKSSLESDWAGVLASVETALGLPCARGWLDLHRYGFRACSEQGWYYEGLKKGIVSLVRGVLQDYPDLAKMTMLDDTPTANIETQEWITNDVLAGAAAAAPEPGYSSPSPSYNHAPADQDGLGPPPDAWDIAQQSLRSGRVREAVELINTEARTEQSGRGRFIRRTQLARIFIDSGNESMALPILEQLASEIDSRHLEEWETSDTVSNPLTLLYRCLARVNRDSEDARKLYSKLCRLDPVGAMSVLR